MTSQPPKPRRSKKEKLRRAAVAAILGGSIGVLCSFLPPQYHLICSGAAKVVGLLLGSP